MLSFQENKLSDNEFIRVFKQDNDFGHYHWHRDGEDRIIESIVETDWMIQIDNELPKVTDNNKVFCKEYPKDDMDWLDWWIRC